MATETSAPHHERSRSRHRSVIVGGLVAAVALLLAACNAQESALNDLTASARSQAGVRPVTWNAALMNKATSWATKIADDGKLSHSTLSDGNPYPWKKLGENVAYQCGTDNMNITFGAWRNSPAHWANIVDAQYNYFAIAVVQRGTCYYSVQEFMYM